MIIFGYHSPSILPDPRENIAAAGHIAALNHMIARNGGDHARASQQACRVRQAANHLIYLGPPSPHSVGFPK